MKPIRITDNVFGNIVNDKSYDKFLDIDGITGMPDLDRCKSLYQKIIEKNIDDLETLAKLEETITQLRCKRVVEKEFKLSQVRGYIYARTPFYRKGINMRDIRVVVGRTIDYGENLDALFLNKEFVSTAKTKLLEAMNIEIASNMTHINEIEEKFQVQCESNE